MDGSSQVLYLIPTILAEDTLEKVLPPEIKKVIEATDYFFVEELRTARRFIGSLKISKPIDSLHFFQLNKDTSQETLKSFFQQVPPQANIGILSEAGCPGIADPGALAVEYAHKIGMRVRPLVGPSSILLALIASGFNGQSFAFHGYLPIEKNERDKLLKQLEKDSKHQGRTQIFMETPYRNNQLLKDITTSCSPHTKLCIAVNLTGANEYIKTQKISDWKKSLPDIHKQPAIFLIQA